MIAERQKIDAEYHLMNLRVVNRATGGDEGEFKALFAELRRNATGEPNERKRTR